MKTLLLIALAMWSVAVAAESEHPRSICHQFREEAKKDIDLRMGGWQSTIEAVASGLNRAGKDPRKYTMAPFQKDVDLVKLAEDIKLARAKAWTEMQMIITEHCTKKYDTTRVFRKDSARLSSQYLYDVFNAHVGFDAMKGSHRVTLP
jgi:hypothetical protein